MLALRLVIVHMKAQHIMIFDGVRNGIGVQLPLEEVFCGFVGSLLTFDLLIDRVFLKDRCARKTKELCFGEEFLNCFVIVAKLRAVAFVKDKDHALIAQRFQLFL